VGGLDDIIIWTKESITVKVRQALYKYVPKELIERSRADFGIPLAVWLRASLIGWAENLLDEARLDRMEYFHLHPIRDMWVVHLSNIKTGSITYGVYLCFRLGLKNHIRYMSYMPTIYGK
jgi:asparagine synthase (glutamine-hydrolysing)